MTDSSFQPTEKETVIVIMYRVYVEKTTSSIPPYKWERYAAGGKSKKKLSVFLKKTLKSLNVGVRSIERVYYIDEQEKEVELIPSRITLGQIPKPKNIILEWDSNIYSWQDHGVQDYTLGMHSRKRKAEQDMDYAKIQKGT